MDGWDDDDEFDDDESPVDHSAWNYYSANQPRKATSGIKTKSERGAIGTSWWSKRWVNVLESLGMGTRLTRGRSYARMGQVLSIEIKAGIVNARVQGSMRTPYNVVIHLQPLSDEAWTNVTSALATQALFAAKLLAGAMPDTIEDVFRSINVPLFPTTRQDLLTSCSCPDWANPCKHVAAVYYILAEQFDEDPFLLFKLRGRSKDEIINALRERRATLMPPAHVQTALTASASEQKPLPATLRLEEQVATFWQAGDALEHFGVKREAPAVKHAALKRLGQAPFEINGQNLAALLEQIYDAIERAVTSKKDEFEAKM